MHRIHSTAKVSALEKVAPNQPTTPTNQSPRTAAQNANTPRSPKTRAAFPAPLEKQADANHDSSSSSNNNSDTPSGSLPPPAKPPPEPNEKSVAEPPLDPDAKPSLSSRMKAGSFRFVAHTKNALFHSWVNVLLIFVPIGIAVNFAPLPENVKPTVVFSMNAVAIIPLAGLLSHATESVASRMGDTMASLLNVTFGNAVELIIFIIALAKNEIRIVQASILGSILANLLLILGMAFLLGGLRFQEQLYNSTVTQMSACLLSLSVMSLLLPTAFHASFANYHRADLITVKISRGTSVVLLLVYTLYLLFQLKSHAYMYESTPQHIIDIESHPGVLADVMNHSDSSDSSSSSSSSEDSELSDYSKNTATRRIRKKWRHRRRRKSTTSSVAAPSAPSAVSSPSTELKSGGDSGTEGYFDPPEQLGSRTPDLLSGNIADTEGLSKGAPLIRDFESEQIGSGTKKPKHKKSHKKQKLDKVTSNRETATNAEPASTAAQGIVTSRVDFVEEPEEVEAQTPTASKRPFAMRQFSRAHFMPSFPNVLGNTVFSNPPPRHPDLNPSYPPQVIKGPSANHLRRTHSLPDRFNAYSKASRQPAAAFQQSSRSGLTTRPSDDSVAKPTEEEENHDMSRTAAVMLLLVSTGLVAFCAELLVDVIPDMISDTSVSQAFIGLIVLPIVGNAAEHVTAVSVAIKNKMDLCIGVAVGSSIQIALFITPVVVIIGWIMDKEMSLYFNLFETVSLFVTVFVVNFLVLDGRSNYLEGALLMAAYVIIAVAAFFYPNAEQASQIGGSGSSDY